MTFEVSICSKNLDRVEEKFLYLIRSEQKPAPFLEEKTAHCAVGLVDKFLNVKFWWAQQESNLRPYP